MNNIQEFFDSIYSNFNHTSRSEDFYKELDSSLVNFISKSEFAEGNAGKQEFGPFGDLNFPFKSMGAISSLDLFGLDEILIFAFYFKNKDRYKNVADIGANIGLHSILMSKCGWNVNSYEPDPIHVEIIKNNIAINNSKNIIINQQAVSGKNGQLDFIRVLGNTTGNHIAGAKDAPYGDLEKFTVEVIAIKEIMNSSDFIKMDVEGEESNIIVSTDSEDWKYCDMMLEVGTEENAETIYNHLSKLNVSLYSQKNNWKEISSINQVPTSYKEGSMFITSKDYFPWNH